MTKGLFLVEGLECKICGEVIDPRKKNSLDHLGVKHNNEFKKFLGKYGIKKSWNVFKLYKEIEKIREKKDFQEDYFNTFWRS